MASSPGVTERALSAIPTGPLGATAAVKLAEKTIPTVPGYEILEPLGRGGMGVVFRARERASGREVAVKWLTSRAREDLKLRFEREARAVSAVRHPNIVSVLGAGSTSEGSWIAMELIQGFSLGAALDAKALGKNALVDVVVKVAKALAAAHGAGVVHRDVKPDNVLVDESGEPRLLDFGLARFLDEKGSLTAENSMLGTLGYMAPEVFEGGGSTAGPACDVYALGAILYEGLTGAPPFGRGTPSTLIARMQKGAIDPLPLDVPGELARVCQTALERDPTRRPKAAQLALELERLSPSPGSGAVKKESEPERKLVFILACVLGLGAGAVGSVFALRGEPPKEEATIETAALATTPAETDAEALPVSLPAPVESATVVKPEPVAEVPAPTPPPEPEPMPAPVPEAPPAPAPLPAPSPPSKPAPTKPAPLTADELRDALTKLHDAIQSDERAKAAELARTIVARAPAGADQVVSQAHVVLGRNALLDLKTAEAEREYLRALVLDAKNKHALLGLVAVNLLEGSTPSAQKRLKELDALGHSQAFRAARALIATAKREQGFRAQLVAVQAEKTDPPLVRTVAQQLTERDAERKK